MNDVQILKQRSALLKALRCFFYASDYDEVESPIRVATPALEDYIDAILSDGAYLRTSPELHMKRLICAGAKKIFQIGSCFRHGEFGQRHRDEFTMLEWYRLDADYMTILDETMHLLRACGEKLKLREDFLAREAEVISLADAFQKYAQKDLTQCIEENKFEEVLCFEVEPQLGITQATFIIDYPASMAALARKKKNLPEIAERFELYLNGLEIANAYSELCDASEQRQRFSDCAKLRANDNREAYPLDEKFLSALETGMPDCGGIALGVDRLAMFFYNTNDISHVRNFADEMELNKND